VETYLIDLSSLLLLGILLGCHYLGFRTPYRSHFGRSLQRAGKLRMLGVSVLAPLSLFLWLEGHSPLLTLIVNQLLLYWLGSTLIEVSWLLRPQSRDWRPGLRLLWLVALFLHAGWEEPQYRDLAYALAATGLVLLALLRLHRKIFQTNHKRLRYHGYLMVVGLSAYYLVRAWTVVPITSAHLHGLEHLLALVLGLAAVEAAAVLVERALRLRRRSEEVAQLAADGFRASLYCGLALVLSAQVTRQDVTSLALSSAFFSVGLGFALKPTLGNFVSGLIQRISKDYFIGDFVSIGSTFGRVTHIDWRTVSLGTLTHDTITIPHREVAHSVLINHSRPHPGHASYLEVKLPRHVPPGVVRRHMLEILETLPEVCQDPEPEVYLMDLDGFANTYRIRWWMAHIQDRFHYESQVQVRLIYGLERRSLHPVQPVRWLQLHEE
jgi:small-conductance mechanosensitive channel